MQQSLIPEIENLNLPGGHQLLLFRDWLPNDKADRYLNTLLEETSWQQPTIRVAGKEQPIPRQQLWYGDEGAVFSYSGRRFEPLSFTPVVLELKQAVVETCRHTFNSVLMNHYRNEHDSVGWHADDEPEFGREPCIASLSLGATRRFQLKPKPHYHQQAGWEKRKRSLVLDLRHGDLLLMKGGIQENWLHAVPKEKHPCEARLNLTFRRVIPER